MTTATGIGSWPGSDVREALHAVRDLLAEPGGGVDGLPYLPELPGRGPGADLVGRGLGLLVGLPVDLQPSGWRLVDRPGRDLSRTAAFLRQDLDELAEAFDGWTGPLKVQVAGPVTLAAATWLPRGERVLSDAGATRDLVASLAEGVRLHVGTVQRLVPGAHVMLQVDEPSLPAALEGRLPTASGYGRVRALDRPVAAAAVEAVLAAAPAGTRPLVHCCAPGTPVPLLRRTGADLALDTAMLTSAGWEEVAGAMEDGMRLYAGCVPTAAPPPRPPLVAETLLASWDEVGLSRAGLDRVVITPACGLSGLTPHAARAVQRLCVDCAREVAEAAAA